MTTSKTIAKPESKGMTFAKIDAALAARGIHLDPWDEPFRDSKRVLKWDKVLALLPDATEDEIASWAEDRASNLRRTATPPAECE
jgi:hypothetical protein